MQSRAAMLATVFALVSSTLAAQAKPQGTLAPAKSGAAITAMDREIATWVALEKGDIRAFNDALGADFTYVTPEGTTIWERAKSPEMLKGCTFGKQTLSDRKSTPLGQDVIVLTYTIAGNTVCNGRKTPSPTYAMSVWRNVGGRWVAAAHSETPAATAK